MKVEIISANRWLSYWSIGYKGTDVSGRESHWIINWCLN